MLDFEVILYAICFNTRFSFPSIRKIRTITKKRRSNSWPPISSKNRSMPYCRRHGKSFSRFIRFFKNRIWTWRKYLALFLAYSDNIQAISSSAILISGIRTKKKKVYPTDHDLMYLDSLACGCKSKRLEPELSKLRYFSWIPFPPISHKIWKT